MPFLQPVSQTATKFKGIGTDILEVTIVGMTHEVAATKVEREMTTQVEAEVGIEGNHAGAARIALRVGVVEFESLLANPF